jgi:hypothetical protein
MNAKLSWPHDLTNADLCLAIGLYEMQREQGRAPTTEFKSWCRQMTGSAALKLVA